MVMTLAGFQPGLMITKSKFILKILSLVFTAAGSLLLGSDLIGLERQVVSINLKAHLNLSSDVFLMKYLRQLSQLSTNHCAGSPCHNGGTCINNSNGFVCQCKAGWTGSTCSEDLNECADPSLSGVICQNGGQCENRPPPTRFSCNCSPEYYGNSCSQKYNDCTQSKCGGKGTCMDKDRTQHGIEAYECVCFPGFEEGFHTDAG